MRHLATYLLLKCGGNENPTAADVIKAMAAVGCEADTERLDDFLAEVAGKDLAELIESAKDLVFVGGGGSGGAAPAAAAAAGGAAPAAAAEKPKEEDVDPMEGGMDMFGGGGGGGDY